MTLLTSLLPVIILNSRTIILLSVPLFALFSLYLFESISMNDNVTLLTANEGFMRGHLEVIAENNNGIFSYQQSDNKIVTHGENCMLKMLFGPAGGDTVGTLVCIGEINAGFHFIGLGETGGPSSAFVDGDEDLRDPADEAGLSAVQIGTIVWTNSTDGSFGTVVISATFTNTGATEVVNEAGLFNSTTVATNGMFAGNNFANVTLNNGDDITINWTVEVGEATVP